MAKAFMAGSSETPDAPAGGGAPARFQMFRGPGNVVAWIRQGTMEEAVHRATAEETAPTMSGSWDFHRALFEEAPYGVLIQDAAERILAANAAARRLLGLREGVDLSGLNLLGADGSPLPPEAFPAHVCLSTRVPVKDAVLGIADPAGGPALWVSACAAPQFRPGEANPFLVQTTLQDITFHKRTEDALRQSEQRFATIFQACPVGIDIVRLEDERFVDVNDAWLEFMGFERAEVIGRTSDELGLYTHPEERRRIFDSLHRGTGRERSETTFISRTKGIRTVVFSLQTVSLLGEAHVITLTQDITAAKAAEAEIKSQLNFVNTLLDTLPVPIYIKDPQGRYVRCNPAFLEMHGLSEEDIIGRTVAGITTPDRADVHEAKDRQLLAVPGVQEYEGQAFRKDGSLRDALFHKASYLDANGAVAGIVGSLLDITDLKRTEEALRASERHVRAKLEAILSPEGDLGVLALGDIIDLESVGALLEEFSRLAHTAIAITDLQGNVVLKAGWQEACARFHWAHPEASRNCVASDLELTSDLQPGQSRQHRCWNQMWNMATPIVVGGKHLGNLLMGQFFLAEEAPDPAFFEAQARRYGFDADAYLAAIASVPRLKQEDVDRAMRCCTGFANMVSSLSYSTLKLTRAVEERTVAQEALLKSERFLRVAQTAGGVGCFALDITLGIWESSETFDAIFGIGPDQPRDVPGWLELAAPESRDAYQTYMLDLIQSQGQRRFDIEFPTRRKQDGQERWIYGQGSVEFDVQGQTATLVGTMLDITERKAAEQERARLHEQLNQVQKLESVGRLAGGVAHDSNNMLMAILMHAELLHEQLGSNHPVLKHVKAIEGAAERSVGLIRQLLAFSRKQVIQPEVLDLNELLSKFRFSLAPLIGEDIEFLLEPAEPLWPVRMDPIQVDQIIMNLAVNARDAMPQGGVLRIETANVRLSDADCQGSSWSFPGEFVLLSVSDTGVGMPQEIQDKIFDPFFTTKDPGKGTGLGLSTVFGIVKQNGGFLDVQSGPGTGAAFRIYLPRCLGEGPADAGLQPAEIPASGKECILIVEDDGILRSVIPGIMERLGYPFILAATPEAALEIFEQSGAQVDVLLTDVVMPGMSGRDLADRVRHVRPDVKVMYMSGYTADMISNQGVLDTGVAFIQKPFSVADLGRKLRGLLGGEAEPGSL